MEMRRIRFWTTTCTFRFTLVELLVVITIISIFAGMLLPVLKKARAMAHQASCTNLNRQIGFGLMAYIEDYHDFFPPIYQSGVGPWYDALGYNGYLGQKHAYFVLPGRKVVNRLLACPAERRVHSPTSHADYGCNDYIFNSAWYGFNQYRKLKLPGATFLITDNWEQFYLRATVADQICLRHNRGANFLFADWHVAWHLGPVLAARDDAPWLCKQAGNVEW